MESIYRQKQSKKLKRRKSVLRNCNVLIGKIERKLPREELMEVQNIQSEK